MGERTESNVYKQNSYWKSHPGKGLLDTFIPPTGTSSKWKHWKATLDLKTCVDCRRNHGKIYAITEVPNPEPPLHPNCRCIVESMESVIAGMASNEGINGADWRLQYRGVLPDYYIHINDLIALGWRRENLRLSLLRGKWSAATIVMKKVIFRMHRGVNGTKQI